MENLFNRVRGQQTTAFGPNPACHLLFFFFFNIYLFIFGCVGSSLQPTGCFVAACGLFASLQPVRFSLVVVHGLQSIQAQ